MSEDPGLYTPRPRPLRAIVEVHAGLVLGVPEHGFHRRWEIPVASDILGLRLQLADRLTEAYAYAGRLPFPDALNWINLHATWL